MHPFLIKTALSKLLLAFDVVFGERAVILPLDEELLLRRDRQVALRMFFLLFENAPEAFVAELREVLARLLLLACQVELKLVVHFFALQPDFLACDTLDVPVRQQHLLNCLVFVHCRRCVGRCLTEATRLG